LQRLPRDHQRRVRQALQIIGIDSRNTIALAGAEKRWRRRAGPLRLIWSRDGAGDVVVLRIAFRREDTYRPTTGAIATETDERLPPDDVDAAGLDEAARVSYYADGYLRDDQSWYSFVYGDYRLQPHLSPEQLALLDQIRMLRPNSRCLRGTEQAIEGGPGTGKTVCATHLACMAFEEWSRCGRPGYVALVLPACLIEDIRRYPPVGPLCRSHDERFFLGDYLAWGRCLLPRDAGRIPEPDVELEALRLAARFHGVDGVQPLDLSLYRAFVLDGRAVKDVTQAEHQARVRRLARIRPDVFERQLAEVMVADGSRALTGDAGPLPRHRMSERLANDPPPPPPGTGRALVVVDEAQDLFRADRHAIQALCRAWRERGVETHLLVLADLNQRVEPTGFDWQGLGPRRRFDRNYRNSRKILDFANRVLELARGQGGCRHPERGTSSVEVAEEGEAVRVLLCGSPAEARDVLTQLGQGVQEERRELIRRLSQQVKVLSPVSVEGGERLRNVLLLSAKQAKGREFAACLAYRLFAGQGPPTAGEVFRWYTLLTRAQSRLLLVLTTEDQCRLAELGWGFSDCTICTTRDTAKCLEWVSELTSEADLSEMPQDVEAELLRACREGRPYLDTYQAVRWAGLDVRAFEGRALDALASRGGPLAGLLDQASCTSLRCLLLRAEKRSWRAAEEAAGLLRTDPAEGERIIRAVADDLTTGRRLPIRMPLEATRVLARFLGEEFPAGHPLPGLRGKRTSLPAYMRSLLKQCLQARAPENQP
jgi:hypothetical protein